MANNDNIEIVARNRKARHDYHIEESFEAGLVLRGTEVKSLRQHKASIKDSFAMVEDGEVYLYNLHIAPYKQGNINNHEPERPRKLLLRKRQIKRLIGLTAERGYTLVPLRLYFRNGWAKVKLALAKGKTRYDKRRDIARRDAEREIERAFKERHVGIR